MGKDESYPEGEGLTSEEKRQLEACLASIPRRSSAVSWSLWPKRTRP